MVDPLVRRECLLTLGLRISADAQQVRLAYKDLALRFHPDRPTGNAEMFKKVQTAYAILQQWFGSTEGKLKAADDSSFFSSSMGNFMNPTNERRPRSATTTVKPTTPTTPHTTTAMPRTTSFMNPTASSAKGAKPPIDKSSSLYRQTLPKKASTLDHNLLNAKRAARVPTSMSAKLQQVLIAVPKQPFTVASMDGATETVLDISIEAFCIAGAVGMYHKATVHRRQDGMKGLVLGVRPKDGMLYWLKEGTNIPTPLPGRSEDYRVALAGDGVTSQKPQATPKPPLTPSSSAATSRASSVSSTLDSTARSCELPPRVRMSSSGSLHPPNLGSMRWSNNAEERLAATAPASRLSVNNSNANITSFASKYGSFSSALPTRCAASSEDVPPSQLSPAMSAAARFTEQINRCRASHVEATSKVGASKASSPTAVVPAATTSLHDHYKDNPVPNAGHHALHLNVPDEVHTKSLFPNQPPTLFVDPLSTFLGDPGSPNGLSRSDADAASGIFTPRTQVLEVCAPTVSRPSAPKQRTLDFSDLPGIQVHIKSSPATAASDYDDDLDDEDFGLGNIFADFSLGNEVEQLEIQLRAEILMRYDAFLYEAVHRHGAIRKTKRNNTSRH